MSPSEDPSPAAHATAHPAAAAPDAQMPADPDVHATAHPAAAAPDVQMPADPDVHATAHPAAAAPDVRVPAVPDVQVPAAPDVHAPATASARITAGLAALDAVADLPLADHVDVYQRLHTELQAALAEIEGP